MKEQIELPGLSIVPNAVSAEESARLTEFVRSCLPSGKIDFNVTKDHCCSPLEILKNRTVIHFGHIFDYDSNTASVPAPEIPRILLDLIGDLKTKGIPIDDNIEPDQVTINVYEPGQGIPPSLVV